MRKRGDESADGRQLEGRYANYVEVGSNAFEFLLDFGQVYSNSENTLFHTRIVIAPSFAKKFMRVLKTNIAKHEKIFGDVCREYDAG